MLERDANNRQRKRRRGREGEEAAGFGFLVVTDSRAGNGGGRGQGRAGRAMAWMDGRCCCRPVAPRRYLGSVGGAEWYPESARV